MYLRKNKIWNLKESSITSEKIFKSRREILKKLAIGSLVIPGMSLISYPAFSSLYPPIFLFTKFLSDNLSIILVVLLVRLTILS